MNCLFGICFLCLFIFHQHDGLGEVGEGHDVLDDLHGVVAGVERAAYPPLQTLTGQRVLPSAGLPSAIEVWLNWGLFIFYQYPCGMVAVGFEGS